MIATIKMHDFVRNGCKAVTDSEKFLNDWFETKKNPCSVCSIDKSECSFYQKLVGIKVLSGKGSYRTTVP